MNQTPKLFFIALLPPQHIQDEVTAVKQIFADRYRSRAALKSPPHITLQPPFEWLTEDLSQISESLAQVASHQHAFTIQLSGFGAFPPRVVFVDVAPNPALHRLHQALLAHNAVTLGLGDPLAKPRPFAPHITVGFRDLSRSQFEAAWTEFQDRSFTGEFMATHLTLMIHNGQRWIICQEFPLRGI